MSTGAPSFTIGIEEEYFLIDPATGDLIDERPEEMMEELERLLPAQVVPEFLNSQLEVGTRVCTSISEAADELKRLRATIATVAEKNGLAMLAASTHPSANWDTQTHTNKERYNMLARDLQGVARRLLICGMHVHIGIEDPELRIDLMGQVAYFLPHLLALSTSSPFWQGEDTGLYSYRVAVFDELPRTGVPEHFDSYTEFQRHVQILVDAGLIEDASKLWWDVRPSAKFPTIEMRLPDLPTRVEDTICIAAFYRCILHMLYRLRRNNQRWRRYAAMLISENRWRAQRYGMTEGLVDFGKGEIIPYADLLDELITTLREDAALLNCSAEVEHAMNILDRGTSADWQHDSYRRAIAEGKSENDAMRAIVTRLTEETVQGL